MTERIGTSLELNDGKCRELHVGDVVEDGNGVRWTINRYRQIETEDGETVGFREWKKSATRYARVRLWNEVEELPMSPGAENTMLTPESCAAHELAETTPQPDDRTSILLEKIQLLESDLAIEKKSRQQTEKELEKVSQAYDQMHSSWMAACDALNAEMKKNAPSSVEVLKTVSSYEIIQEISRRAEDLEAGKEFTHTLFSSLFSDKDLKKELEERGWEVHATMVVML